MFRRSPNNRMKPTGNRPVRLTRDGRSIAGQFPAAYAIVKKLLFYSIDSGRQSFRKAFINQLVICLSGFPALEAECF